MTGQKTDRAMQLRYLRYFVTLAQTRHFAKAASACGVSQPTLSAGLNALEQELGKRLVERDRRFVGLTEHGEAILPWAQQIVSALASMNQTVSATNAHLEGEVTLAAIPAALPYVGILGDALLRRFPGVSLTIQSCTSREIETRLRAFEVDAGLTYLDHEPLPHMLSVPLYGERFVFVARRTEALEGRKRISWREAAAYPLCLLHQGMQFRRILDARLAQMGLTATPRINADSNVSLLALVKSAEFATIVPDGYAQLFSGLDWAIFLPFDQPDELRRVGLVVVDREPLSPLVSAILTIAKTLTPAD